MFVIDFDSRCDVFYNNSCFKHIKYSRLPWEESNQACNDIRGYLTSIHSENENAMLANLVTMPNSNIINLEDTWIGLDAKRYIEVSTWVDDSPITYTNTLQDYRDSTCIIINANGLWAADTCSTQRQYICRKTGK